MEADAVRIEALFLVHQLLRNEGGGLANAAELLKQELNDSGLLGEATIWNGEKKSLTVEDLCKRHARLPDDLLISHLQSFLQYSKTGGDQFATPRSLLSLEDLTRDDPAKKAVCKRLYGQLVDAISLLCAKKAEAITLQQKSSKLRFTLDSIGDDEHDSLKYLGMAKELKHVEGLLDDNAYACGNLHNGIAAATRALRQQGRLGGEVYRGACSDTLSWVQHRALGNTGTYQFNAHTGLARVLSGSAHAVRRNTALKMHFQYSTSGHFYTPAYCAVFDKSGRYALTGADDALVKVWDLHHARLVMTLKGHKGYITLIAVSPDNSLIASSCTFGDIRLWRLKDGECVAVLKHNGSVNWLKFDDLTGAIASGGDDGFAYVWDLSRLLRPELGPFPLVELLLHEKATEVESSRTQQNSSSDVFSSPVAAPAPLGIFPWSAAPNATGRLPLAHPQITDTGELPPVNVLCLDICPTGDYIATGREDGVANIWRFCYQGDHPGRGSPANTSGPSAALNELRGNISQNEWEIMESIANHLIVRLVGHVATITDIKFNSKGDRLITGSLKEGSIRIWSFSSCFTKYDHIVLSMSDTAGDSSSPAQPMRRQRSARNKNQLFNVSWSHDDLYVFTLQGADSVSSIEELPSKLKMWDGMSGALLRVIVISDIQANVLAVHPRLARVVVTAGTDGVINVWDAWTGEKHLQHQILCPPNVPNIHVNTPIKILDASFSSDGSRIIATDHIGRMHVFGVEDPSRFRGTLIDQYFSTDYNDFYLDDDGFAMDIGTNLPVHLVPGNYLCRMDGSSYGLPVTDKLALAAMSPGEVEQELLELRRSSSRYLNTLDASYRQFKKYKNKYLSARESKDITVRERPKIATVSHRQTSSRIVYREAGDDNELDASGSDHDPDWISVVSSEGETMFRRRTRISTRASQSSQQPEVNNNRRSSRARTNRVIIVDSDLEDDLDNSETSSGDESPLEERPPRRSREAMDASRPRRPANTARPPRERVRVERPPRERTVRDTARAWFIGNGFRRVPLGVAVYREWALQDEPSDSQFCPQVGDSVVYFPQGHAEHLSTFHETVQPPWTNFPARWSAVECRVTSVQYDFPTQGEHNNCPSVIARVGLTITGIPMHIQGTYGGNYSLTEFSNPSTRRSSLDKAQYSNFIVTMRKAAGLPDFIIPSYLYRRAASIRWRPGMKFSAPFLEAEAIKFYPGTIVGLGDYEVTYPNSAWECLKVRWDEGGSEDQVSTLGPWDAFLLDETGALMQTLKQAKFQASAMEPELIEKVLAVVNACLENELYDPFAFPIDTTVFEDYLCIVPVPMNLDLIRTRLTNNFYRQVAALEHDVNMIYKNCVLYNLEGSPIVALAAELISTLLAPFTARSSAETSEVTVASQGRSSRDRKRPEEAAETSLRSKRGRMDVESSSDELPPKRQSYAQVTERGMRNNRSRSDTRTAPVAESSVNPDVKLTRSGRVIQVKASAPESKSPMRAARKVHSYAELDGSDVDMEEEEEEQDEEEGKEDEATRGRYKDRRVSSRRSSRQSSQWEDEEESEEEPRGRASRERDVGIRRSSRRSSREEEDESEEEVEETRGRRERQVSVRRSSRRGSQEEEDSLVDETPARRPARLSQSRAKVEEPEPVETLSRRPRVEPLPSIPGRRLDPDLKRKLQELLAAMENLDEQFIFADPVTEDIAPGYFQMITTPMDFSTIKSKFHKRYYESVEEMAADMRLMYANCMLYNDDESELYEEAMRQNEFLEALMKNLQ